jgi:hypothetical protein
LGTRLGKDGCIGDVDVDEAIKGVLVEVIGVG